jgi:hypothetical protein
MSTDTSDVISDSLRRATRQRHNNEDEEVLVAGGLPLILIASGNLIEETGANSSVLVKIQDAASTGYVCGVVLEDSRGFSRMQNSIPQPVSFSVPPTPHPDYRMQWLTRQRYLKARVTSSISQGKKISILYFQYLHKHI